MKRHKKKILLFFVILLLFLLSTGIGYAAHLINKTASLVEYSHEETGRENDMSKLRKQQVDPIKDNVSVLFIGVDTSEHRSEKDGSRSDALLLATFNKRQETVNLLSIPRDTYVYVREIGDYTKINHAHSYGGPRATMETVEDFLNIPVDYYVRINFEAFIDVIDTLDGITYNVPFEINEMDSSDRQDKIHLDPGYQTLNGEEALALVRTRKYDNDFERGKRQQEVIKKISNKATSASTLFKLNELLDVVGTNMTTNLTFDEMKSFLYYGVVKNVTIESLNFDGDGDYMADGLWYFHVDETSKATVQQQLHDHLDLPNNTFSPIPY